MNEIRDQQYQTAKERVQALWNRHAALQRDLAVAEKQAKDAEKKCLEEFIDIEVLETLHSKETCFPDTEQPYLLISQKTLYDMVYRRKMSAYKGGSEQDLKRSKEDADDEAQNAIESDAPEPLFADNGEVTLVPGTLELVCYADGSGLPVRGGDLSVATTDWRMSSLSYCDYSGNVVLKLDDEDDFTDGVFDNKFLTQPLGKFLENALKEAEDWQRIQKAIKCDYEGEFECSFSSCGDWDSPAYKICVKTKSIFMLVGKVDEEEDDEEKVDDEEEEDEQDEEETKTKEQDVKRIKTTE